METPEPAGAPGARTGRPFAIFLFLAFGLAIVGAGLWALSSHRTKLAGELKARLQEAEAAKERAEEQREQEQQQTR